MTRGLIALLPCTALLLGAPDLAAQAAATPTSPQWLPDGYRTPPHSHPTVERVEVKQGTFLVGMGDRLDAKKTLPLTVGDTAVAPAGMHHYSVAGEQRLSR